MELIELNAWADKLNIPRRMMYETAGNFRRRIVEQFQKPLQPRTVDRYCIKEECIEHVLERENYFLFTRTWLITYSDNTTEQLITREKFKK